MHVRSDLIDPATGRKGNIVAKSNYQFKKRQKEMARKKKQDEKRQRKLEDKKVEADKTEIDSAPQWGKSGEAGRGKAGQPNVLKNKAIRPHHAKADVHMPVPTGEVVIKLNGIATTAREANLPTAARHVPMDIINNCLENTTFLTIKNPDPN